MKKKFSLLMVPLLGVFFLVACRGGDTAKEIAQVDSLFSVVKGTRDTLATIDHELVRQKYELYKQASKELQDNFYEIKTDENWPYICEYRNVRRPLRDMSQKYNFMMAEVDSSLKQLEHMKYDLQKGSMGKEEFDAYFRLEAETASNLIFKIRRQVELTRNHMINFDTIHPYIEEQLRIFREKSEKIAEKNKK